MKKFLAVFLSIMMVFVLASCGDSGSKNNDEDDTKKASDSKDKDKDGTTATGEDGTTAASDASDATTAAPDTTTEAYVEPTTAEVETTEAYVEPTPTPAGDQAGIGRVTMDLPDGYAFVDEESGVRVYANEEETVVIYMLSIGSNFADSISEYASVEDALKDYDDAYVMQDYQAVTFDGHDGYVATYTITEEDDEGDGEAVVVVVEDTDNSFVIIDICCEDTNEVTDAEAMALNAALSSIKVQ